MCIITQMYCLCANIVPVMCDTDRSFCHSVITEECVGAMPSFWNVGIS